MNKINLKKYLITTTIIFLIVGAFHLTRAILKWPSSINNFDLPIWLSYISAVIAIFLAYSGFRLINKE